MDDAIYGVSEGAEEVETAEPLTEEESLGAEEQETAEPVIENEKTDADARFAEMRRQMEDANRRAADAERQAKEMEDALGLFFEGEDKPLQAQAYVNQVPLEELRAQRESEQKLASLQTENESLKTKIAEAEANAMMSEDLAELQKAFPDDNIKNINDLGDDFLMFRFTSKGVNSATDAYRAMKAYQTLKTPKKPDTIGSVKTSSGAEKGYFTREEVQVMSQEEVSKNYSLIRKSMSKW